ncbi:MAG TPA: YaiI/YqxD family protein [Candidatus Binatia bacterium]
MLEIFVDADACPVKEEIYRVARRCALPVSLVANSFVATPPDGLVRLVTVGAGDDVADDWIAGRAGRGDIVITADVLLAARCLKAGARVVDPKGREFTDDSIGSQVAGRELSRRLRESGVKTDGPAPMTGKDRGRFLNTLDTVIQSIRRQ